MLLFFLVLRWKLGVFSSYYLGLGLRIFLSFFIYFFWRSFFFFKRSLFNRNLVSFFWYGVVKVLIVFEDNMWFFVFLKSDMLKFLIGVFLIFLFGLFVIFFFIDDFNTEVFKGCFCVIFLILIGGFVVRWIGFIN